MDIHTPTASASATLEKLVALCKRRGFVYPSSEIYGGLNGVYDKGPLGYLLQENLKDAWIKAMTCGEQEVLMMDGALLGSEGMWTASGHVENFHDPLVDCKSCKARFRADDVDLTKNCPRCGNKDWSEVREFHLMFKTHLGATAESGSIGYLRPETAQAIFVNFKNVLSTNRVKIPFGIAQVGKAFRNEITPKQFLFRMREFSQMEVEFFCKEETALDFFAYWTEQRLAFYRTIGLDMSRIRIRPHEADELSHYSKGTSDVEYLFPFGWKELEGIAYRTNFDLSQHMKYSGKDLSVYDEETKQSYVPHVVECSVGLDRLFLTTLFDAYDEDTVEGETRIVLRFKPSIAPISVAIMPLHKQQTEAAQRLYRSLKEAGIRCQFDTTGSIGKRYRRQDEIGTPYCVTFDFDTETSNTVTIRDRDTLAQERVAVDQVADRLKHLLATASRS